MSNIQATLSQVAEAWIHLNGKPFSLQQYPMYRTIYDGRYKRTLLKTGRQVAKSTTLANFTIIECALIPFFSTMFVSPSKEQTTRFSTTRVNKTMNYSPIIKRRFLHPDLSDRVFHKQFTNGSEMLFTYGFDDADRLRGPSTDRNCFDECQDMLYDPVIVVGNETMSNSNYHFETYAGTPKTMENTIQYLWEISTQAEWIIKCEGCGKHVYIDSEASIGKTGPICVKCGKNLNPLLGQWVELNPGNSLVGFHISQLIMPQNVPICMEKQGSDLHNAAVSRWDRILTKYREDPLSTFRNEVLGVSDSIGTRLISKEELESLCTGSPLQPFPDANHLKGCDYYVAGVDWSGGGTTGISRTVVWIWGHEVNTGKIVTKAYKVYPGINPVEAHEEVVSICKAYNVKFVVGDAGEGALANDLMRKGLGGHRITQVQYGSHKHALEFNGVDRYLGDRTTLIDNFFMFLKDKKAVFGPLSEMKVAIEDMLNEYEEVTTLGKKVWRHFPQKPDDCLHAALMGWLAYKIVSRDLRFWQE